MLNTIRRFHQLCNQFLVHGNSRLGVSCWDKPLYFSNEKCDIRGAKSICTFGPLNRDEKKSYERIRTVKEGLAELDGDSNVAMPSKRKESVFPDENLPTRSFNGIMFKELPIVNIKVTLNNTIMNLTEPNGRTKMIRSCGIEGFRNVKKGTNLAAQATAVTFGRKAVEMGYKSVRIRIQGLGPGRTSSIRGLTMGGLDIISVTDNTHVSDNPPRAKKRRRI